MKKNSLLFIFAHPDDETFACGIAISKYVQEKAANTHLLCATRGQAGKPGDPPLCAQEELGQYREMELREAASILGLTSVDIWDYEDKHLNLVPIDELVVRIHKAIEQYQPEVVITFAPHGISGHPDHRAISDASTRAVQHLPSGSSVRKFYYVTRPASPASQAGSPPFSDPYESITTIISGPEYAPQVGAALRAHRTQHLSVNRVFPGVLLGDSSNVPPKNHFILAWHNLPGYVVQEKESDFFAGSST
jgi:LmbE family N-acetylglucosaminyl deacetylase